ncbi:hypothetical protein TNCV_3141341 [Trichonephila clavipes]|nr:hypothetical protein TNCV_3141341 [Trichonephila clavipes]
MPLRHFGRQYELLTQFKRGRIIGMMEAVWSARRVARQLGRSDCVIALNRPVIEKTATSKEMERNGTKSTLATNPDSISAVTTIVSVCGDTLVNISILPLIYSDTPLPQLV